jgi:ubiquitin-activating enzyme E1
MEAMGKLVKMNDVLIGMRGLGVETAKNLILAGPASVTIVDDTTVGISDLGANFYLDEKHVGKMTRAQATAPRLSELNPYVKVSSCPLSEVEKLPSVQVVCQTELFNNGTFLDPQQMNEMARGRGAGYICSVGLGPWGFAFVDYGDKHIIND